MAISQKTPKTATSSLTATTNRPRSKTQAEMSSVSIYTTATGDASRRRSTEATAHISKRSSSSIRAENSSRSIQPKRPRLLQKSNTSPKIISELQESSQTDSEQSNRDAIFCPSAKRSVQRSAREMAAVSDTPQTAERRPPEIHRLPKRRRIAARFRRSADVRKPPRQIHCSRSLACKR